MHGSIVPLRRRRREASGQSPSASAASAAVEDLREQGWRFVGPTTMHVFLQAIELIYDYVADCVVRARAERKRGTFPRPGH